MPGKIEAKDLNIGKGAKRFKYRSFSERVEALNINVLHRTNKYLGQEPENHNSHLNEALESWKELNLSTHFVAFVLRLKKYVHTLPQIVFHKDEIIRIFEEGIEKADELSLEPLLDLITKLAQDLGEDLVPYYDRIFSTIKPFLTSTRPEILEWSFNCIAYLFKYLSRSLVADLRPTFDLLGPLLGDENSKFYVRQLAAEAFAFLLRKARGDKLKLIIGHMFDKIASSSEAFRTGVAYVILEAAKNVNRQFHSRMPSLLKQLLVYLFDSYRQPNPDLEHDTAFTIMCKVTIALVHHSDQEHFSQVFDIYFEELDNMKRSGASDSHLAWICKLIYLPATVRKGSRVKDYMKLRDVAIFFLETALSSGGKTPLLEEALNLAAATIRLDDSQQTEGHALVLVKKVLEGADVRSACRFILDLSNWNEFGQALFMPVLRFADQKFAMDSRAILLLLLDMLLHQDRMELRPTLFTPDGFVQSTDTLSSGILGQLERPTNWEEELSLASDFYQDFSKLDLKLSKITLIQAALTVAEKLALPVSQVCNQLILLTDSLSEMLKARSASPTHSSAILEILLGRVFAVAGVLSEKRKGASTLLQDLKHTVIQVVRQHPSVGPILKGACAYLSQHGSVELEQLVLDNLLANTSSTDHTVRLSSVKLLQLAFVNDPSSEVADLAVKLEQDPPSIENIRDKSLLLRKICIVHGTLTADSPFKQVAPRLGFALFSINFSPLWQEGIKTLSTLAGFQPALIWSLLEKEIQDLDDDFKLPQLTFNSDVYAALLTDSTSQRGESLDKRFDCTHLYAVEQRQERNKAYFGSALAKKYYLEFVQAATDDVQSLKVDHFNRYLQLVKTLVGVPSLAEQHSRFVVPLLLRLLELNFPNILGEGTPADDADEARHTSKLWQPKSGKDAKNLLNVFLSLFAKFKNPKALYQTQMLRDIFMRMLAQGEIGMSRLALECIFAWKSESLQPYMDNLRNLVDDTKFRDELSVFPLDPEDTPISAEHRDEVLQVVLRLFYGRMLARGGKSSAKTGMAVRRVAILTALSGCTSEELQNFLTLMIGDLSAESPLRAQIGFMTLLEDVIKQLSSRLVPFMDTLVRLVLGLSSNAQKEISDEMQVEGEGEADSRGKQLRQVRQLSFKCLNMLFMLRSDFNFDQYMPTIFTSLVQPRLANFSAENSQTPSSLFNLIATWASKDQYVRYLVEFAPALLDHVYGCLAINNVSVFVANTVLDVVDSLLTLSEGNNVEHFKVAEQVLIPHIPQLLDCLQKYFAKSQAQDLGRDETTRRQIEVLATVAVYVTESSQAVQLLDFLLPTLRKPARVVPEKTKADILQLFLSFQPILKDVASGTQILERHYRLVSALFGSLNSRACRSLLVDIMATFGEHDSEIKEVAIVLRQLNAYSESRLDEPDFDARLTAFALVNEQLYSRFSAKQWMPILHTVIFFGHDADELSTRSNASFTMRRFVDAVSVSEANDDALHGLFTHVLFPGIKKGIKSIHETVREEFVAVLAHALDKIPSMPQIASLTCLTAGGEVEANFFKNIFHIQTHRRVRAMKRLADETQQGHLETAVLSNVILPLLHHFIVGSATYDHTIVNEALVSTGVIAGHLPWGHYYRLLTSFMRSLEKKEQSERIMVRAIINVLDHFHFDVTSPTLVLPTASETVAEGAESEEEHEAAVDLPNTFVDSEKILSTVRQKLLPAFDKLLKNREEVDVLHRVPMAFSIVKLIKVMPEEYAKDNLSGTLTTLCHVLKSRSLEVRDMTRATILKIAKFLGPSYLSFILKEMRGALQRGYQLHVLGYSLQNLLANVMDDLQVGDLDYCLDELVDVMMNDIFSAIGAEKDAEEYVSKMKEMKSSKSFASFEMITKLTSFSNLMTLLQPLKSILRESDSGSTLHKADEVLRRISLGINASPKFDTKAVLIFCHGVITQNLDFVKSTKQIVRTKTNLEMNYEVAMKRTSHVAKDHFSTNAHKFVQFALSIMDDGLRRGRFDLDEDDQEEESVAMLDPFVAAIGDCIFSKHQGIVVAAMKVLCILIKYPLPSLKRGLDVLVKQTLGLVRTNNTTRSEISQACFRFLTVVIRDRQGTKLKDDDLIFLVQLIKPDLEEPDRQHVTFALIRAIMSRKFVAPEIYDLVDEIAKIMVTNQSTPVRELSRSVYLQFLLDYPQGRGRLKDQMTFLAKNLAYVHQSGRESVMEMLNQVIVKFGDEILQDYLESLFLSIAMVLVNDEAAECREMASNLIKGLLRRADAARVSKILTILDKWLYNTDQPSLLRLAIQIYGLYIDSVGKDSKDKLTSVSARLSIVIKTTRQDLEFAQLQNGMLIDLPWEITYYALNTLTKIYNTWPDMMLELSSEAAWDDIVQIMTFPHAWVRLVSCRLVGLYLTHFDPSSLKARKQPTKSVTMEFLIQVGRKLCLQLQSKVLSNDLGMQNVKNIVFLAKCFHAVESSNVQSNGIQSGIQEHEEADEEEAIEDDANGEPAEHDAASDRPLKWLLNKLAWQARFVSTKIAVDEDERIANRHALTLQRSFIFKAFAAVINFATPDVLQSYLVLLIIPMYRVENDDTLKGKGVEDLKTLAREVLSLLQEQVGTTAYLAAFEQVQKQISVRREARREAKVVQAVSDPAASARRKLQKGKMRTENRKRKAHEFMREKSGRSGASKRVRGIPNV